jgi:hypothetical protein
MADEWTVGERDCVTQRWDFPVDEPVSLPAVRRHRLDETIATIAARNRTGTTIRVLVSEYGVSREAVRRALCRVGIAYEGPTGTPAQPTTSRRARTSPPRPRPLSGV